MKLKKPNFHPRFPNYITSSSILNQFNKLMEGFMCRSFKLVSFIFVLALLPMLQSLAQEKSLYNEGNVWSLTFVRSGANKSIEYINQLAKTWVASMDEAKKEGLILDYKILSGNASNKDDYDLILMIENKSLADFDPNTEREAKFDAIEKKIRDDMKGDFQKVVDNYTQIRQIFGTKIMRELHLK